MHVLVVAHPLVQPSANPLINSILAHSLDMNTPNTFGMCDHDTERHVRKHTGLDTARLAAV